jgi:hypothetical protein
LELRDSRGNVISINDYWEAFVTIISSTTIEEPNGNRILNVVEMSSLQEFNNLQKADIRITTKRMRDNTLQVELNNVSRNIAAGIKLNVVDNTTGEILLPAYFSDGYINLLGREKRVITLDFNGREPSNYRIAAEYFNQK